MLQAKPEIRIFFDNLGIITNSTTQIARLLQQQGTIEKSHQVVGLKLQYKVKVFNSSVVIAHLCTEKATIVVTKEVIRVKVEGRIIVGHRPTKVVLIVTSHSSVDIIV